MELSGADRRHLRGLANPLKAIVQIGDAGLRDGVVAAADAGLADHELIKIRIAAGDRDERRDVAARIATATNSALAGVIGRVAILYRPSPDPEARRIRLPSSPG